MQWDSKGDDEELSAKAEMEKAIEKLMSLAHEQNIILTGFILQAEGMSATDDVKLLISSSMTDQSSVTSLGLLAILDRNVHIQAFELE